MKSQRSFEWCFLPQRGSNIFFSGGQIKARLICLIPWRIHFRLFFCFFFFLPGRTCSSLALLLDHSLYPLAVRLWGLKYNLAMSASVLHLGRAWTPTFASGIALPTRSLGSSLTAQLLISVQIVAASLWAVHRRSSQIL